MLVRVGQILQGELGGVILGRTVERELKLSMGRQLGVFSCGLDRPDPMRIISKL